VKQLRAIFQGNPWMNYFLPGHSGGDAANCGLIEHLGGALGTALRTTRSLATGSGLTWPAPAEPTLCQPLLAIGQGIPQTSAWESAHLYGDCERTPLPEPFHRRMSGTAFSRESVVHNSSTSTGTSFPLGAGCASSEPPATHEAMQIIMRPATLCIEQP